MKKTFLIIFCIVFLSGCSAVYEIEIKNDTINENLKIIETDSSLFDVANDSGWTVRQSFNSLLNNDEFSHEEYEIKSINNENQLGVEYTSSSAKSVLNSSILNQCYTDPVVTVIDDIVTIETGNNFECYEYYDNLSNIEVRFKTNHKILSTNCDVQEDDVYVWNITESGNKNIKISYYDSVVYSDNTLLFIILSIVGILVLGFIIFLLAKMNKRNKI